MTSSLLLRYWFLGFSAAFFTAAFFVGANVFATHWAAGGGSSSVGSGMMCYTSTVFPILRYTPASLGGGGPSSIKSATSVAVQAYGVMASMVLWGLVGTVFITPCTCVVGVVAAALLIPSTQFTLSLLLF